MNQTMPSKVPNIRHKHQIVKFDAYSWEGKLGEVSEWCCENFADKQSWWIDWQVISSRKEWFISTDNEQYATMFALRWS
jgi:hypothetical protein